MKNYSFTYGSFVTDSGTEFRLVAPRAEKVYLVIFKEAEDISGKEHEMQKAPAGYWTINLPEAGYGTLYGYRLIGPESVNDPEIIIADPYTQAAVTQNTYRHVAKSLIVDQSYDWENDHWISIDPRDLIIYEMHLRDMTAGKRSGTTKKGTYQGLVEEKQRGGLVHLKKLGVNAVQILPLQEFANVELPYMDETSPVLNTWNPYARNHWGYMTTFFNAPEAYYSSDGNMDPGAWNGASGKAVSEFKDMVKTFHKEKIAVIMDVVYNHVSNYDYHPFKYIDREMYFRLNDQGDYIAKSGCGNDTRSESPVMRQLILESLKFWMINYHVDGFRFDLGYLIDSDTRQMIIDELRAINPHVIILAEPWGGGYDPSGFSDQDWASFNDQIRNGVKGQNPRDGLGFIFGKWQGDNTIEHIRNYAMGSLRTNGGQYLETRHSVNYLESHDDYTFGDFIRIGTGLVRDNQIIEDRIQNVKVSGEQLRLNKLGALFLFTSQGITFLHEGQEWARSKVIAASYIPDKKIGRLDHNSYEKDNPTNWLNWIEPDVNRNLVDYYTELITMRKTYQAFRRSNPKDFQFFDFGSSVTIGYLLQNEFIVILNGDSRNTLNFPLPSGKWKMLASIEEITLEKGMVISGDLKIQPQSGFIFKRN